jgi:hypothetical protein
MVPSIMAVSSSRYPPVRLVSLLVASRPALAADDRPGRLAAAGQHPQHDPAAEGVAGQVPVTWPEAERLHQRQPVLRQHVGRVGRRVLRPRAVPVAAKVRHDDPEPVAGDRVRHAGLDELPGGAGESVQQYQWPPVPGLPVGEQRPVTALKLVYMRLGHDAGSLRRCERSRCPAGAAKAPGSGAHVRHVYSCL